MAADIRDCANMCDAFAKQQPLLKVLKAHHWHKILVSAVRKMAMRKSEMQFALALHAALAVESRNAAELAVSSTDQR